VFLLPAFDEFIIGYADRSAALPAGLAKNVVSSNGIFRAVILYRGQARGLWKKEIKRGGLSVMPDFFTDIPNGLTGKFKKATMSLATFYSLPPLKR
jgi:hypothetical protein